MLFSQIKTASDLRGFVENAPGDSFQFSRGAMKFFGDTMRNYGIRKHEGGAVVELYRKRPVKHGLQESSYWRASDDGTYAVRDFAYGRKEDESA